MRTCVVIAFVVAAAGLAFAQGSSRQIVHTGRESNLPFSPAVKAGGLIFASGTAGVDPSGQNADIKAQTKLTLDSLSATLTAAGSSISNAVSVMVYLRNASDFAGMNEVYSTYWPKDPPARTTVIASPANAQALVEISMTAVPNGAERVVVHPGDWSNSPLPYSYGIKTGNTLFLAGLVSRDSKTNTNVKGDMAAQTKTVMDNGAAILKAAGMSYGDVVSARVFITDAAAFQDMNKTYRPYFPADPPARATVKSGLTSPDYQVEISMVAVKDAGRRAYTTPAADGTPGRPNPNLSAAIGVGNRLYVAGIPGNTDANKGDAKAQVTESLTRIGRTLKAAGYDWTNAVDVMVYLSDLADYQKMNDGYRAVLMKDFPARTTVGVGLMGTPGIEIMVTAIK